MARRLPLAALRESALRGRQPIENRIERRTPIPEFPRTGSKASRNDQRKAGWHPSGRSAFHSGCLEGRQRIG
ncbi:MAG: hypothetical protein BGN91_15530 [Nitrobacter sp. 62-13]|nr:MAG: hypothetical protein BGN91_15530 [Nitrobacter sp. 62-13]